MENNYVDFKGKRFYPPFRCLCCGIAVSVEQFCHGRLCGYCDMGKCQTSKNPEDMGKAPMIETKFEERHGRKDIFDDAEDVPEVKK